jgi:NADPH:quinone reductase-like Zn-dependent oxidoreductase
MKAVVIHAYGGPEVLIYEDVPRPEPGEDELLVRIYAAGVNPADWQVRAGLRHKAEEPFSIILGLDVSGVVEDMGARVSGFQATDEVYGMLPLGRTGGYAEYVAAPASGFALKPESLNHIQAAAMPVASLTSWQALFEAAKLLPGQRVLIHAASGGVGHIAVQFARWKGAYVIGTASGRNEEFLRKLGVDEFVNYQTTRFEDVVGDVDVVLNTIPQEIDATSDVLMKDTLDRSLGVLKKGGILVSISGRPSPDVVKAHAIREARILARPDGEQLSEIARLVDSGYVHPAISSVLALRDAHKAHEISQEGHTRGKIVLQVV